MPKNSLASFAQPEIISQSRVLTAGVMVSNTIRICWTNADGGRLNSVVRGGWNGVKAYGSLSGAVSIVDVPKKFVQIVHMIEAVSYLRFR